MEVYTIRLRVLRCEDFLECPAHWRLTCFSGSPDPARTAKTGAALSGAKVYKFPQSVGFVTIGRCPDKATLAPLISRGNRRHAVEGDVRETCNLGNDVQLPTIRGFLYVIGVSPDKEERSPFLSDWQWAQVIRCGGSRECGDLSVREYCIDCQEDGLQCGVDVSAPVQKWHQSDVAKGSLMGAISFSASSLVGPGIRIGTWPFYAIPLV